MSYCQSYVVCLSKHSDVPLLRYLTNGRLLQGMHVSEIADVQKAEMCGKISVINLFLIAANLVSTFVVSVFLHITSRPKKHTV